ncbi:hypothetical protein GCM10008107_12120 [Psychrosphaera saromensis]|uniref:Pentapeptide repeat-containing protein n=1 Tax=Psychrosphaera saromensis TaxID=716813 RepID=A0A2S7UW79_9GAMM|nr:pentapeptide repeat-containing protein [Psychrosphaera saromensis]PQJ53530.1 hypothetical protein BTO11_07525 [Psychrosphaera saromensis]GHB64544.1 hypothetical protein GCM10008107_12120 [Psychrosphaera saromensis]GLQ15715.1 hypothetical protein GCM10007917_31700 [Psychrosphaera saromensis]
MSLLFRINIILILLTFIFPAKAYKNDITRIYPCEYLSLEQRKKEANNIDLFIERAESQSSKKLCFFTLEGKVLPYFNLRNLNLHSVNFRGSGFSSADAENTKFFWSSLEDTDFSSSNLRNAKFNIAKLNNANLEETDLRGADLYRATLHGTNLTNASFGCLPDNVTKCTNITGASFHGPSCEFNYETQELKCNQEELVFADIKGAKNIKSLVYDYSDHLNFPPTLMLLRKHLRENGYEREARELTYVIQKGKDEETFQNPQNTIQLIGAYIRWLAFDLTVEYGVNPSGSLALLLYTLVICSFIYGTVLLLQVKFNLRWIGSITLVTPNIDPTYKLDVKYFEAGSYRNENLLRTLYLHKSELAPYGPDSSINIKHILLVLVHAIWFSILSSFHFGWRDLNVGNWLARIQPTAFTYRPNGLFSVISGIQSLLSIYFLAIFVLSSYGNIWG